MTQARPMGVRSRMLAGGLEKEVTSWLEAAQWAISASLWRDLGFPGGSW